MQAVKDVIKGGYAAAMCGSGLLDAWLRVRPSRGRATILNYHWISPDVLTDHLTWLRRSYQVISLDACEACLRGETPMPPNAVAITFDDAYRQFHDDIVPVLGRFGVPATMFVPTQSIDDQRPLWCNVIKACVYAMSECLLEIGGERIQVQGPRRAVYHNVIRALNVMPVGQRDDTAAGLLIDHGLNQDVLRKYQPMTWPQIRGLPPSISLGGHTVTHPNLAMLSPVEIEREISESRRRIENRTWRPVRHFAYPFGQPTTVTAQAASIVRECGFTLGLTTMAGTCGAESDRFLLPRLGCDDISTGQILAARLSQLWVRMTT